MLDGASFSPAVLAGVTQEPDRGLPDLTGRPLTQAVVAAANEITAAICSVDGSKPDAVCESRGVLAADAALKNTPTH